MKFIPDYNVIYHGGFYEADEEFEIDAADAEEMRQHGEILEDEPFAETDFAPAKEQQAEPAVEQQTQDEPAEDKPARRGRPRKEAQA